MTDKIELDSNEFHILISDGSMTLYESQDDAVADLQNALNDDDDSSVAKISREEGDFAVKPVGWEQIAKSWAGQ